MSEKQYSWCIYENETERGFMLDGDDSIAVATVFLDKRCSHNEIDCQLWQVLIGKARAGNLNSAEDGRRFVEGWLGITTGQILRHWGAWSGSDLHVCKQLDQFDWKIECSSLGIESNGPTLSIAIRRMKATVDEMAFMYQTAKSEGLSPYASEQAKVLLNYRSVEDLYNHSKEESK